MERQRNPRGQGDRLRTEIVQAASIMLAASGDAGQITLRGVAKQVGIAATSVYLHFPDVAHLVAEAMAGFFGELERAVAAAGAGDEAPAAVLRLRCRAFCRFATDHPGEYRVMFESAQPDLGTSADFADSPGRPVFESLARDIARCGPPAGADPFRLAVRLWATLHGLVSLRIHRPRFPWPPLDELVDEAVKAAIGQAVGAGAGSAGTAK